MVTADEGLSCEFNSRKPCQSPPWKWSVPSPVMCFEVAWPVWTALQERGSISLYLHTLVSSLEEAALALLGWNITDWEWCKNDSETLWSGRNTRLIPKQDPSLCLCLSWAISSGAQLVEKDTHVMTHKKCEHLSTPWSFRFQHVELVQESAAAATPVVQGWSHKNIQTASELLSFHSILANHIPIEKSSW